MSYLNIYDVRSANQWLKQSGYGQLHISSRSDRFYKKVYVLSYTNEMGGKQTLCSSPGLGEVVEQAAQIMMKR